MEEISLFHQRGCRKNRNMALLSDILALDQKTRKKDEL